MYLTTHQPLLHEMENLQAYAQTDLPILIYGETGVGKEMMARGIHRESRRRAAPFVVINCAGLPENMLEAELFGFRKGAFTGAIENRRGRLVAANNGTVLLDEIGDLPFHLQVKLLRCLEEKQLWPLGATESIPFHARFLAATNCDIPKMMKAGTFREDLYYRIAAHTCYIPPLRDRSEDIEIIMNNRDTDYSAQLGITPCPGIDNQAVMWLTRQSWPGNVRELQWAIYKLRTISRGKKITYATILNVCRNSKTFPSQRRNSKSPKPLMDLVADYKYDLTQDALKRAKGNISKAAQILSVHRTTLHEYLARREEIKIKSALP